MEFDLIGQFHHLKAFKNQLALLLYVNNFPKQNVTEPPEP